VENGRFPVLTRTSIPFSHLFPRSALVVHHGGIGTCAQALACGVPQVISPYTFDQPDNAFLLWQLGISNSVDFLNDSADDIAATISEVMSSTEATQKIKEYQLLTVDKTDSSADFLLSLH
jgi:UDP:flavonoid glycosyltransferase YjiC (YdhE family)